MDFEGVFGSHGLIALLGLLGALLLMVSVFINQQVAYYTEREERHREKRLEYYRNTLSQLGVILLGISVSLFIFFFQQNYLERQRQVSQTQELLAKLAVRLSRAAALMEYVAEIDPVLDNGGAYLDPKDGGSNLAITASGLGLVRQVEALGLLEREIDLDEFAALQFSVDFQLSPLVHRVDPTLWFSLVKDEADLQYAMKQFRQDYGDLQSALGSRKIHEIGTEPELASTVKNRVLDVLWDLAWLRDRSRRLVGRACWFLSHGPEFLSLEPIEVVEARYDSHSDWLQQARTAYAQFSAGGEDCYTILKAGLS